MPNSEMRNAVKYYKTLRRRYRALFNRIDLTEYSLDCIIKAFKDIADRLWSCNLSLREFVAFDIWMRTQCKKVPGFAEEIRDYMKEYTIIVSKTDYLNDITDILIYETKIMLCYYKNL
jgi:hypothetical protein